MDLCWQKKKKEEKVGEYSSLSIIGKKKKKKDQVGHNLQRITAHFLILSILSWPKNSFELFCNVLWKNPNEVFDQPSNILMN